MSPGKAAAQAGHAYVGSLHSELTHPHSLTYLSEAIGTKICLVAPGLRDLIKAWVDARLRGLPAFLVHDSGCANFYGGRPIVTALGVGPCHRPDFLKHLPLHN